MTNLIMDQIKLLMQLGYRAVELSDCCKGSEPSFMIRFHNDGSYSVDFYSYCLNLEFGGRHHTYSAKTAEDLEKKLAEWIILAEHETNIDERIEREE